MSFFFPGENVLLVCIILCIFLITLTLQSLSAFPPLSLSALSVFLPDLILRPAVFCVRASADLPGCLADVTRCLQLAAAAGGPSAQTESAGGIKGPSPKKATGVGLRLVCSPFVW